MAMTAAPHENGKGEVHTECPYSPDYLQGQIATAEMVITLCANEMQAVQKRREGGGKQARHLKGYYVDGRQKSYEHLAVYLSNKVEGYRKALAAKDQP